MFRLKKIFSPRAVMIILGGLVFMLSISFINEPAQSKTQGIVTEIAIDIVENEIEIACSVLTPESGTSAKRSCYTGRAKTLSEAVGVISLQLGKDLGFAQCDVVAVGQELLNTNIATCLDFFTRNKKVGRNVLLVSFNGQPREFCEAIIYLEDNLALTLSQILTYNKEYVYATESNIEDFYLGYYGDEEISTIPKITLTETPNLKGVAVQITSKTSQETSSDKNSSLSIGQNSSGSSSKTLYVLNDGTTSVLKRGKLVATFSKEKSKTFNLFNPDSKYGIIVADNVQDEYYQDATVVLRMEGKEVGMKYKFDGQTPVVYVDLNMYLKIEEIIEENVNMNMLRRKDTLITKRIVEIVEEKTKTDMMNLIDEIKDKKIDIFKIYTNHNKFNYKKWKNYIENLEDRNNYLNNIKFEIKTSISQYL